MKKTGLLLALFTLLSSVYAQKFMYRYEDASVHPDYNRSYTIMVEPAAVNLTVDSYGNELFHQKYTITKKAFNDFVKKIKACKLKKTADNPNAGCTGGTTDIFTFDPGKKVPFTGSVYNCGGVPYGNITGNIQEAKNIFAAMVPELKEKIDGTRKK